MIVGIANFEMFFEKRILKRIIRHIENYRTREQRAANIFVAVITLILLCVACDQCDLTNSSTTGTKADIYFSAIPVNDTVTYIFKINSDGSSFTNVLTNARMSCPPSSDNKICFLRKDITGKDGIYILNLNKRNDTSNVISGDLYPEIKIPVISPDGSYLVFYGGNNSLYLYDFTKKSIKQLSSKFCVSTLPQFSPDGKQIAFFEGSRLDGPLTIKAIRISNILTEIFSKSFSVGITPWNCAATIQWSNDASSLVFVISLTTESDYIYNYNIKDNTYKTYLADSTGAFLPSLSPDMKKICYCDRRGNLRLLNSDMSGSPEILTNIEQNEYNINPQWSADGSKILFVNYYANSKGEYNGSLQIADLSTKKIYVLSNNIYGAFWFNLKK
jgi:Tol biopolymer transport system component